MVLLGLKIGNCTLFIFCSPNIQFDNHHICLDVELIHTATFSHAKVSLQIPIQLIKKLQAHVLLHNSILGSTITNYLGLNYIVAYPPPPPEPPDEVVIQTPLLVQHLLELSCLSSLLLLTGMPLAMTLTLAFYMEMREHAQEPVADFLSAKHHGITLYKESMVHDGDIRCCEVRKHVASSLL
jgi:hypothetical protein